MIGRLWPIIRKEFLHLFRDPRSLGLMFFLPVFLLVIYGYAASFDIKNVPIAVLDLDKSSASRELIAKFTQSGYFVLVRDLTSTAQFAENLDSGRVKMIFSIPRDFSQKINAQRPAQIQVLVDGADPTWAASALGYLNGIIQNYQLGLVKLAFVKRGLPTPRPPLSLETRVWYNDTLRSINFFVPGLICVILMQMAATLTSLTIVSEKEQGTMEALVVSPVRKNELMLGKILPYVLIAFFDVIMVTALGVFWFGVPFNGNFGLLLLGSFIFLLGAMSLGVLISASARSSQEAIQIALMATMLPSILLSGFVFPIENMPWLLQGISLLLPARYYMDILRGIFLKGVGLNYLWPNFLLLLAISTLVLTASVRRFKKRIE
ncbi:MAG TPA: ABC transporter permease [Candidatus Sulfotelmatobacter sp.]|nr:ABC transporter permease [Candidatus Sulfotelmatobacter sp.]